MGYQKVQRLKITNTIMSKKLSKLLAAVERAKDNASRISERVVNFAEQLDEAEAEKAKALAELSDAENDLAKLRDSDPDSSEIPVLEKQVIRLSTVSRRISARHKRLSEHKIFERLLKLIKELMMQLLHITL